MYSSASILELCHGLIFPTLEQKERMNAQSTGIAQEIDETNGDTAIDVEDERILLRRGDVFDGESVIQSRRSREMLLYKLLDEFDSEIRVRFRFDLVTDAGDELVRFAHRIDKFSRGETGVHGASELGGGTVESATEAVADGQETGDERGDKVLAGSSGDDSRHRARDGRTVIGGKLKDVLEELCACQQA